MKRLAQSPTFRGAGRLNKRVSVRALSEPCSPCRQPRLALTAASATLVTAVFLIYVQGVRYDFVNLDDNEYVTENRQVAEGLTGRGVVWAFTHSHSSHWHPLTWISLMLDATCCGVQHPGGFHLTNLLLHAANAVLVLLWLWELTGAVWPSGLVAAVFAVHPTHVESVAWITERKDVLSGLFGLLALLAYTRYARVPGVCRYLLVAIALALGLTAKPMLVTWPLLFFLIDYWPLRRPFGLWQILERRAARAAFSRLRRDHLLYAARGRLGRVAIRRASRVSDRPHSADIS